MTRPARPTLSSRLRSWLAPLAALVAAAGSLLPSGAGAQVLSLFRQYEGPYDYVVTGGSHRANSNTGGNPCTLNNSSTASISIPGGATVVAAFLYWAGSETSVDGTVTLSRPSGGSTTQNADGSFQDVFDYSPSDLAYFGAYDDVTNRWVGNGTYGVSGLSASDEDPWCNVEGVVKGWAMVVIYRQTGLPIKRIQLRHGLRAFRQETESVTLDGFLGATTPDAKVTFLLYEGDPNLTGSAANPEQLLFNSSPFTDGLNPANNPFNSTANTPAPGRNNVHGVDLDTYNASAFLAPRARSAAVALSTGDDMAILQFILTSLSVSLADVTPDGLPAPEQRLPGGYSRTFEVENPSLATDNYDLIARFSGTPGFVQIDSVTGPGSTRGARADSARILIPAGGFRTVTVWYRVPVGIAADNQIHLLARSVTYPTIAAARDTGYTQLRRVAPQLTLAKSVSPQGVFAPATELTYTMQFSNVGSFAAVGVVVADSVPPQVLFKPGSVTQALPAGIGAAVEYSSDGGATWTYTPVSGGCGAPAGFDGCVRRVRWRLLQPLPAGAAASAGTVTFKARIK